MPTKKTTSRKAAAQTPRKTLARSTRARATAASRKTASRKAATKPARSSSKSDGSLSLRDAAPSFTVNDVERSLAFYRDVLGFAVKQRWDSDGTLMGVELAAGKVVIMLTQDDWKKGRDRDKGQGVRIYYGTEQDVDGIAARIEANGGTLTQAPRDEEWGMRAFTLEDPDGYKMTIMAKR